MFGEWATGMDAITRNELRLAGLSHAVLSDQSFEALDCQIVLGSRGWKRGGSFLACPLRLQRGQPIEHGSNASRLRAVDRPMRFQQVERLIRRAERGPRFIVPDGVAITMRGTSFRQHGDSSFLGRQRTVDVPHAPEECRHAFVTSGERRRCIVVSGIISDDGLPERDCLAVPLERMRHVPLRRQR